jgi:hypothetical protein
MRVLYGCGRISLETICAHGDIGSMKRVTRPPVGGEFVPARFKTLPIEIRVAMIEVKIGLMIILIGSLLLSVYLTAQPC